MQFEVSQSHNQTASYKPGKELHIAFCSLGSLHEVCWDRYIHNNPVKAGIVHDIIAYPYSSAGDYFSLKGQKISGIISEEITDILKNRFKNFDEFLEFHNIFDSQEFLDIKEEKEEHDFQRAKYYIKKYAREKKIKSLKIIENIPFFKIECIEKCREELGLSKRTIENILNTLSKGD